METLKAIARRKSVRSYKPDPVPEEVLNTILAAGCAAPVGMGMYDSLHLTVIQNTEMLGRISEAVKKIMNRGGSPLYGAPVLIIISSRESMPVAGIEYANASCLIDNMLIAATDQGLGSVYIWGAGPAVSSDISLMKALAIPEGFKPVSGLVLGFPESPDMSEKELKITISLNRI
ncbi:nitroreductase family protein [Brucepastera parasyntrophica]|uniref:nitroreductase family protein n=1 Tax=Brucepastera parasyntrophica TaxID=2880008 RepID=UPI00210C6BE5|nr:nitroreductase family protein [Brucepastera parasyntrophica]ULQ59158.1 nitroreductase family protein [Brucepastera parasyntrophica]